MLRRQEAIITRDSVEPSLAGDASDETVNSNQTIQP